MFYFMIVFFNLDYYALTNFTLLYPILRHLPNVIPLAVGLALSDEAGTRLIKELMAFSTLETCCVPLQVWGYPQDILVVDLRSTPHT